MIPMMSQDCPDKKIKKIPVESRPSRFRIRFVKSRRFAALPKEDSPRLRHVLPVREDARLAALRAVAAGGQRVFPPLCVRRGGQGVRYFNEV